MPVQLTIHTVGAELTRQGLEDIEAQIPQIGRLRIYQMVQRARKRLTASVPRPSYPIRWDSERQRRAFFASDGFGRGIPTKRTGRYQGGYEIIPTGNGYTLRNSADYAVYVGGSYEGAGQSRIHASRYPLFQGVVEDEVLGLPLDIEQYITYYARSKGF